MINIASKLAADFWTDYGMIIMIVVVVIGMYFFMIRPSQKARKQSQEMQQNLTVGTKVMTSTGIRGTIVEMNNADNSVVIKTGTEENPSYLTFDRRAITYLMGDTKPKTEEEKPDLPFATETKAEEEIPAGERKIIQDKNTTLEEVEPPKN